MLYPKLEEEEQAAVLLVIFPEILLVFVRSESKIWSNKNRKNYFHVFTNKFSRSVYFIMPMFKALFVPETTVKLKSIPHLTTNLLHLLF
jgi:hypothetical protein